MIKQLNIVNYKTHFILGNNECEKLNKRPVLINISIRFNGTNIACFSDKLQDTVCYSNLTKFLDKELQDANINLIEHAAQFIYTTITNLINDKTCQIKVEVIKPAPFKENVQEVSFAYSDW